MTVIKHIAFILLVICSLSVHAEDIPVDNFTRLPPLETDLPDPLTERRHVDQFNEALLHFRREILAGGGDIVPEFMGSDTCFCRAPTMVATLLKANESIPDDQFKIQVKGYINIWLGGGTSTTGDLYHTVAVAEYDGRVYVVEPLYDGRAGFIPIEEWHRNLRGGLMNDESKVYRYVSISNDPAIKADKRSEYSLSIREIKQKVLDRPAVNNNLYRTNMDFKKLVTESLANIKILYDGFRNHSGFRYLVVAERKKLITALTVLMINPRALNEWREVVSGYDDDLDIHMLRLHESAHCLQI